MMTPEEMAKTANSNLDRIANTIVTNIQNEMSELWEPESYCEVNCVAPSKIKERVIEKLAATGWFVPSHTDKKLTIMSKKDYDNGHGPQYVHFL